MLRFLVSSFGFDNVTDFKCSFIHTKLLSITLPITLVSTLIETYLGIEWVTWVAFVMLLTAELISGIMASVIKGRRISSIRFSRFYQCTH